MYLKVTAGEEDLKALLPSFGLYKYQEALETSWRKLALEGLLFYSSLEIKSHLTILHHPQPYFTRTNPSHKFYKSFQPFSV